MLVVFRTDASLQIGTGHVMRCLTLADGLRSQGAECIFICRAHEGNLLDLIAQRGHTAFPLPASSSTFTDNAVGHESWLGTDWYSDARQTEKILAELKVNWLVVDHYALDSRWENYLRSYCRRLMVIDDLADRPHDCDLLLDQNLGRTVDDYKNLLPDSAVCFVGPQYVLLRPEFAQLRSDSLERRKNPQLKRLLITMGGVDKDNVTGSVLEALKSCSLPEYLSVTIVMGPHAPWLNEVKVMALAMPYPTEVLVAVKDMAALMVSSDLAIGAAGSTSWERCCLGLPTIQLVLAANQEEVAKHLEKIGAVIAVSSNSHLNLNEVFKKINNSTLKTLSNCAASVCDGGALPFIFSKLFELDRTSNE